LLLNLRGQPQHTQDPGHASPGDAFLAGDLCLAGDLAGLQKALPFNSLSEEFDAPVRAVARHLWTGGHSSQRLRTALNMVIVQESEGKAELTYHVINIGAGHSVPTGSNRRGIYLVTEVVDRQGKTVASKEWMFAPWYGNRPDDKAFLEEDKTRKDAVAATQADAQGPHEAPVRAGEERILSWTPDLSLGEYIVNAKLVYDLNRYNERSFTGDQTEIYNTSLPLRVAGK